MQQLVLCDRPVSGARHSGPATVSPEQLEALPAPQTFPFRGACPQVGANGKGEERVSGEGERELAETPGRRENAEKRGGHGSG